MASPKRFVSLGGLSPMHVASDLARDIGTRQLAQRAFQHAMPNLRWLCSWVLHLLAAAFLRQHLRFSTHPSTQLHMRCTRGESWTKCTLLLFYAFLIPSLLSCFSSSLIRMFGLCPGQTQTPLGAVAVGVGVFAHEGGATNLAGNIHWRWNLTGSKLSKPYPKQPKSAKLVMWMSCMGLCAVSGTGHFHLTWASRDGLFFNSFAALELPHGMQPCPAHAHSNQSPSANLSFMPKRSEKTRPNYRNVLACC